MLWRLYAWLRRREFRRRLKTPRPGESGPSPDLHEIDHLTRLLAEARGEPVDTGGGDRPIFRSQFGDDSESHTSPHSEGSNCTCAAAAMALDFHTRGADQHKPGTMRHNCPDQEGGTDLNDMKSAWSHYGETLDIRSGDGWDAVMDCLRGGRGVILQGMSQDCGCSHAIYVHPEQVEGKWVVGDPIRDGWTKTSEADLRRGAEDLWADIYFAVTKPRDEASEAGDMGIFFNPTQWDDPNGTDLYLESACKTLVTTTSPGGFLYSLGPAARQDENGMDADSYAILVSTSKLVTPSDGQNHRAILWAKRSDLPEETNKPEDAWDESIWKLATDITGRYPCPPPTTPPDPEPEPEPEPPAIEWYQSIADKSAPQTIPEKEWTALEFDGLTRFPFPDPAAFTLQVYGDMPGEDERPSYIKLRVRRYLADGTEDPTSEDTKAVPVGLTAWSGVLTSFGRWEPDMQVGFDVYHDGTIPIVLGVRIEKSWNGEPGPEGKSLW